jgi:hypothetical protein
MCVAYEAASDVLQAQSDSGISGTLVQRIKSQIINTALSCLYQPQAGREIDCVFAQK